MGLKTAFSLEFEEKRWNGFENLKSKITFYIFNNIIMEWMESNESEAMGFDFSYIYFHIFLSKTRVVIHFLDILTFRF